MKMLTYLKPIIEMKSGAPTIECESGEVRNFLGFAPDTMREDGFDPSTIELREQFFARLESFFGHPVIGEYQSSLTPAKSYEASGVWVCTLHQIRETAFGEGSPESDLFRHGYIPIAGDGGGNGISFHFPSGLVVFAHHERTAEIISGDNCVLSEDIASFLDDFVNDRLTTKLDELD